MYLNYLGESFPHSRNAVALNLSISDAQSFANKSYLLGTPFHRNLPLLLSLSSINHTQHCLLASPAHIGSFSSGIPY